MANNQNLSALQTRLGVQFVDAALLNRALTHSSAGPSQSNNERLEFLGDRVLGLAVAELLHEKFSTDDEGNLAKRFNNLVRKDACAEVARAVDLGTYLILGSGEDSREGRSKTSILADACEALLGAIFIDQGFLIARDFIYREWASLLANSDANSRDPKSTLQEWAQGRNLALPCYKLVSRAGPDHAPEFTVEVSIDGVESGCGKGTSKRSAEQAAAQFVLVREGI